MTSYPGEDPQRPQDDQPEPTAPIGRSPRPEDGDQPGRYDQPPQADRPEPTIPYGQQQPPAPAAPQPGPYGPPPAYGPPWSYGPPPAYGPPGTWQGLPGYAVRPPAHPQSTLAMVLGLVGLVGGLMFCGLPLLVSPFAWAIGRNAVREIQESAGALGGESEARVGMVTGIVGTAILGLGVLALLAFGALALVSASTY